MTKNQQAKTPYDVRRYMTLVQVLAKGETIPVFELAEMWGIDPQNDYFVLVAKLARHAVAYHRNEEQRA